MSERKFSAARHRAEVDQSGFETSCFKIPDGLNFFKMREGTIKLDIIPYVVKKGGFGPKGLPGGNPFAETGWLYYERTFYQYQHIGPDDKKYVSPSKSFGKPDFIAEYVKQYSRDQSKADELAGLVAKKRQLFLVYDHDEPEKGVQLFEFSYHKFGKLLDTRVQSSTDEDGWDLFYYPDEDGMSLRLTVSKHATYGLEVSAIDFIPRKKSLPKELVNHGFDLDEILICPEYEQLKRAFLGNEDDPEADKDGDSTSAKETKPKQEKPKERKKEEEKQPPKTETVAFEKGQRVVYEGKEWNVHRVSADGSTLTLMDDDDDVLRAEVGKVKLKGADKPKSEDKPKDKPKKQSTADECGLKKDMEVSYEGKKHTIIRISPDGTSLTLMDENDEPVRAIGCDEVSVWKEKKEEKSGKSSKSSKEPEGDDEPWDKEWDDE